MLGHVLKGAVVHFTRGESVDDATTAGDNTVQQMEQILESLNQADEKS